MVAEAPEAQTGITLVAQGITPIAGRPEAPTGFTFKADNFALIHQGLATPVSSYVFISAFRVSLGANIAGRTMIGRAFLGRGEPLVVSGGRLVQLSFNVPADDGARVIIVENGDASTAQSVAPTPDPGGASTSDESSTQPINNAAFRAFLAALAERWDEDDSEGMDELLTGYVFQVGAAGIVEIALAAERGTVGSLVLVEIMRLLGRWSSDEYRAASSWFIKRFLTSGNATIRDGALIGLLLLEDKTAIPMLERAISVESVSELRRELQRGLDYLRSL